MPIRETSASPALESLGRVTDLWLDPKSAVRTKGIEALAVSTGFPAYLVERAIDNVFGEITRDKIREFIRSEELPFSSPRSTVVLHIGAGNVFTAWLHGVVITLLLGHQCWIKPSMVEPVFAKLWLQSVQMADLQLAQRTNLVSWKDELLHQVQAVVAYGTDETLEELSQKISDRTIFVGYGHKISVALLLDDQSDKMEADKALKALLNDCELFDLNGCLSPQIIYVEGPLIDRVQGALGGLAKQPEIKLMNSLDHWLAQLKSFNGVLSSVGVAGDVARLEPLMSDLEKLGVTRICQIGQMQRPPLTWRNGGISLVHALKPISPVRGSI